MGFFWQWPKLFFNPVLTFEFTTLTVNIIFELIYFLVCFLMITITDFLKTASTLFLHQESSCLRDGREAFRSFEEIDKHASYLQQSAIEKSTYKCYQTGARDYISFCLDHQLSIQPTPQTLSCYIASSSQSIASAPKYLTGARHFLQEFYPDFDKACNHPLVHSTIQGAKKVRADPVIRKLPLCLSHLSSFVKHSTSTGSYDDLLFSTIMSCAFYACHRMGELIIKSDKSLFDWRKIIKRSSLILTNNHAQYHLPYHKADSFFHSSDIVFSDHDIANPVQLLQSYTSLQDIHHGPRSALFICEDGSLPNRSWFDANFFQIPFT